MKVGIGLLAVAVLVAGCQSDEDYFSLEDTFSPDWKAENAAILEELGTRRFAQDQHAVARAMCDGFVLTGFATPDAVLANAFASRRAADAGDIGPEVDELERQRIAGSLAYFKAEIEGETVIQSNDDGTVVTILAKLKTPDGASQPLAPSALRAKLERFWTATDAALANGGPLTSECRTYAPAKLNIDEAA